MQLDELTYPVEVHYVAVDSRARDRALYPDPASYVVPFDRVFKEVVSVELVYALYSKAGDEDYVNLAIDELSPNAVSNSNAVAGAFTQLPLRKPKNEYSRGTFRSIKVFPAPLNKLGRFTVRFVSFAGGAYPIREHMLRFEITCLRFENPRNKDIILTRDVVHAWKRPPLVPTAAADAAELGEFVTPAGLVTPAAAGLQPGMRERECRRHLGLPPRPYAIQGVDAIAEAFRARYRILRANGADEAQHAQLKRAFKTLAQRYAAQTEVLQPQLTTPR